MKITHYLALFAAISVPSLSYALQLVEPVEGHNSFVKISAKENTRIAVEGGKIRSLIAIDGELTVEKDEDRGQLFIRPVVLQKPINVRLITSSGATYNLVMQAVDIPQEDVIIREAFTSKADGLSSFGKSDTRSKGAAGGMAKAVREIVTAMSLDEPQTNVSVRPVNQEFSLWENTRFVLTAVYTERELVGEKYKLSNTGKNPIRLVEQELYRKGVVAVAIENMQLEPGQSTNIYVVRSN